jgi:hypothetical protein
VIINPGAQVSWVYAGQTYYASTAPVINGQQGFLPIIVR